MTKSDLNKLIVVLPCHGLEDFPTHHIGAEAESLLANWTSIWHPSLIAATKTMPTWISNEFVNQELDHALILAPSICSGNLPDEVLDAVSDEDSSLISGKIDREDILNQRPIVAMIHRDLDVDLVDDFFSLGYAYLQVQLMTRQLRYSSSIDLNEFSNRLVAAAQACVKRDRELAKQRLVSCFDLLLEERNNFYPTNPSMLNVVLVASSTIGELGKQLAACHRFNLLLGVAVLEQVRENAPHDFSKLKQFVRGGSVGVVLSGWNELPMQLISIESVVRQLQSSARLAMDSLEIQPEIYGSYCYGLSPQIPNVLEQLNFRCAIHTAFASGSIPNPSSPTINWQGLDGTNTPALSVPPIDANAPEGFLKLGVTIGEMLDGYHHAELLLVHWPGQHSRWMDELIRIEKYGPLLGEFKTMPKFFETNHDSGFSDTFAAEDYKNPCLNSVGKDGDLNPLSKWADYWQLHYRLSALANLTTLLVTMRSFQFDSAKLLSQVREWQFELEKRLAEPNFDFKKLHGRVDQWIKAELPYDELSKCEANLKGKSVSSIINPTCVHRAVRCFEDDDVGPEKSNDDNFKTVPLSAFGVISTDVICALDRHECPPVLDFSQNTKLPLLRNEFFEVQIDPLTGGVRSVNRSEKRGNLFSQQLACRMSDVTIQHGHRRQKSRYSKMVVQEIRSESIGERIGSITTVGYLVDGVDDDLNHEPPIVRFEQTISVARGSDRIEFNVLVEPEQPIVGDRWRNYVASRIAWSDEDAVILRSENEISDRVYQEKFTAPNFVEINCAESKISLLPAGLPFHRRSSRRTLDTLLLVEGENRMRARFAIAVDAQTSIKSAIDYQSPCFIAKHGVSIDSIDGWIFHLNCKNVVVTYMDPTLNDAGTAVGIVMRLQETEGRPGELRIMVPFKLTNAHRCNFLGEWQFELQFEDNVATCNFLEFQYFQVEFRW